jgi:hypothetical protein
MRTAAICAGMAKAMVRPAIASIGKQGSNWRLVLRSRWDEEVILDQNFNLVSVQQLTQPKQSSPDWLKPPG